MLYANPVIYATRATVDLDALRHNLLAVRSLAGDRLVLATVKANAYGHGAVPVSQFIEREHLADWLGVETVQEAVELVDAGIELPVLKLSLSFPDELVPLIARDVALTVASDDGIDAAEAAAATVGEVARVHLKVDTGMNRIGCAEAHAVGLARRISACRHIDLQGVFTHLPISDAPDDGYTDAQLARFQAVVASIQDARADAGLPPVPLIHASNSGGILGHGMDGLTMVRPGIMLYGYYPDAAATPRPVELRPVMTITSAVSFVKRVVAGETVGYSRTWTAPTDRWIATVPVGYADGFSRLNSNPSANGGGGGSMLINGGRYPVAGRVCMDATMLDLGPADRPCPVAVGDKVTWLGVDDSESIDAADLAAIMGTISHEVLCLVGARVPRDYV